MSDYPECEKLSMRHEESQTISEFLEWLGEKGMYLGCYRDDLNDTPMPIRENTEQILAKYFDIDLVKVEKERRAMLENL